MLMMVANKGIPVFYDDKMIADIASFSPSAGKPRGVMESWQASFAT